MLAALNLEHYADHEGRLEWYHVGEEAARRLLRRSYDVDRATHHVLVSLVIAVQESLWDDKPVIVRSRAEHAIRSVRLPDRLGDVVTIAFDLGLGGTHVQGGYSLAQTIGALRRPIMERLEGYARQLIQAAVDAGEVTLSLPIPQPPKRPPSS